MSSISGVTHIAQFVRIAAPVVAGESPRGRVVAANPDIAAQSLTRYQLLRLRDAIEAAKIAAGSARVGRVGLAELRSEAPLGLDNSSRQTTLASTEEVNTTPTSFSPFGPAWTGLGTSTALATVGGVYDGSGGTGVIRFEVRRGGVRGLDRLQFRVRNTDDSVMQNVNIQAGDPLTQDYGLNNGLSFSVGAGTVTRDDAFEVNVSDAIGSVVDPSKPFNGVRLLNPNLEPGHSVSDGVLRINGVAVPVSASDSIDSVIGSINASGVDVTAAFDVSAEGIVLTHVDTGPDETIVIDSDDSGFAAAVKLAGAIAIPGKDADIDVPLGELPQFSGVQSGEITVNDSTISVDVGNDSLRAILDRISSSAALVSADYVEQSQRVRLKSKRSDRAVRVGDPSTGLLAALNITASRSRAGASNRLAPAQSAAVARSVGSVTRQLNGVLATTSKSGSLVSLGASFQRILADAAEDQTVSTVGDFGLRLSAGDNAARLNRTVFDRSLQRNARATLQFLVGSDSTAGLLDRLAAQVELAIADINARLGSVGSVIDQRV